MQPFDEGREPAADRPDPNRRVGLTVLAVLGVLLIVLIAILVHLAGGTPTHGQ